MNVGRVLERPKIGKPKQVSFDLMVADRDRLDFLCDKFHRSRSCLISAVVLEFLDQCEKEGYLSGYEPEEV